MGYNIALSWVSFLVGVYLAFKYATVREPNGVAAALIGGALLLHFLPVANVVAVVLAAGAYAAL